MPPTNNKKRAKNTKAVSVDTQTQLANELNVSTRTISTWASKPGFPRNADGSYPLMRIIEWRIARAIARDGNSDLHQEKLRAQIRKLEADTQAKRMQNDVLEGRRYVAVDVDHFLNCQAALIRSRLEMIPDAVALEMPPEDRVEVREICAKAVFRLLSGLAEQHFVGIGTDGDD